MAEKKGRDRWLPLEANPDVSTYLASFTGKGSGKLKKKTFIFFFSGYEQGLWWLQVDEVSVYLCFCIVCSQHGYGYGLSVP